MSEAEQLRLTVKGLRAALVKEHQRALDAEDKLRALIRYCIFDRR